MYKLIYDNNSIITFPKCGCTQLIKICKDIPSHNHSYTHNKCSIYGNIHKCGSIETVLKENGYVIFRYMHQRIESFFKANYTGKLSIDEFIDFYIVNKKYKHNHNMIHHFEEIHKSKNIIQRYTFVHLSKLNKLFLDKFKKDLSKYIIINKTYKGNILTFEHINKINKIFPLEIKFLTEIKKYI